MSVFLSIRKNNMDQDIENFCVRFSAGAGSTYVWRLDRGCLRACLTHKEQMCPLSAQATLEQGKFFPSSDFGAAIDTLALGNGGHTGRQIMCAADRMFMPHDVKLIELRARLLRICGLEAKD